MFPARLAAKPEPLEPLVWSPSRREERLEFGSDVRLGGMSGTQDDALFVAHEIRHIKMFTWWAEGSMHLDDIEIVQK